MVTVCLYLCKMCGKGEMILTDEPMLLRIWLSMGVMICEQFLLAFEVNYFHIFCGFFEFSFGLNGSLNFAFCCIWALEFLFGSNEFINFVYALISPYTKFKEPIEIIQVLRAQVQHIIKFKKFIQPK